MVCAQCGAGLPEGQATCSACGAPAPRHDIAAADEETHRLLAEANLLRVRKQHDDAIALCTRVLRLDADNATAHSLLGEIYRDQGNYREALGWFKMAVQLDPGNAADRKKLDEMIDRVFRSLPPTDLPAASPRPTGARHPAHRVREVLGKLRPVHLVIGLSVLFMGFMLLAGLHDARRSAPKQGHTEGVPASTPADIAGGTSSSTIADGTPGRTSGQMPQVVGARPDPVEATGASPSTATNGGQQSRPVVVSTQDGATAPQVRRVAPFDPPHVAPATPITSEEMTQQTETLKTTLAQSLKQSKLPSTLDNLFLDPRTHGAVLDFTIPRMPGAKETKQGLIYSGLNLVWVALEQDKTLTSFTLRGFAQLSTDKAPSLAMLADVTPEQAASARSAKDYAAASQFLGNLWWRSDIAQAPL